MQRHTAVSVLMALSICFIAGCLSISNPEKSMSYYTLEYDPPSIKKSKPLPYSLFIERFQVAPLYDSAKIIYRMNTYKREAYSYHRWRTNPGDMVTQLLARDFKRSSLFKSVFTMDKTFPSSHILKGTVEEIFEKDSEEQWEGILTINVALIRKDKNDPCKSVVFQKQYAMKEVCSKKNPQALAEAISKSLQKISFMIINDTYESLLKQK